LRSTVFSRNLFVFSIWSFAWLGDSCRSCYFNYYYYLVEHTHNRQLFVDQIYDFWGKNQISLPRNTLRMQQCSAESTINKPKMRFETEKNPLWLSLSLSLSLSPFFPDCEKHLSVYFDFGHWNCTFWKPCSIYQF